MLEIQSSLVLWYGLVVIPDEISTTRSTRTALCAVLDLFRKSLPPNLKSLGGSSVCELSVCTTELMEWRRFWGIFFNSIFAISCCRLTLKPRKMEVPAFSSESDVAIRGSTRILVEDSSFPKTAGRIAISRRFWRELSLILRTVSAS